MIDEDYDADCCIEQPGRIAWITPPQPWIDPDNPILYRSRDAMKDRDGLNSTISCGYGESRGTGRSPLLDDPGEARAQKIVSIGLRMTSVIAGDLHQIEDRHIKIIDVDSISESPVKMISQEALDANKRFCL